MKKKFTLISLISVMTLSASASALGAEARVEVNGEYAGEAQNIDGSTYLPVGGIFEKLGYTVEWDTETKTVKIWDNKKETAEESNINKALEFINTFATGDTDKARELLDENYIQHNLAYGTGENAFIESVEYLASAPVKTTVKNIRAFEDGDYVILQNVYNFAGAGEQVAFDIFRFENGLVAEHWDNLASIAEPNLSGHTQTDGETEIKDIDKTEENKELVAAFVGDVLRGENPDNLTNYFDGDNYIQHKTSMADGLTGLNAALSDMADNGIEMIYDTTHMVLGSGNFVLAVSEGTFAGEHTSYYDLFRVENGKIAEHWDVIETIADESTWANNNGKF